MVKSVQASIKTSPSMSIPQFGVLNEVSVIELLLTGAPLKFTPPIAKKSVHATISTSPTMSNPQSGKLLDCRASVLFATG